MSFSERFEKVFRYLLPSPFTIAILLTLVAMVMALLFGNFDEGQKVVQLMDAWQAGLWNTPLLAFAVQMMLILVLGHILALAPVVNRLIEGITSFARSSAQAVYLVCLFTLLLGFFNWGLGLIFGAILARKMGEKMQEKGITVNYALLGAAGYSGMMVWHGGISGSAPIKVVEDGHIREMMAGIVTESELTSLSAYIPFEQTIFSGMNITAALLLLLLLPLGTVLMNRFKTQGQSLSEAKMKLSPISEVASVSGAERLDYSRIFCIGFALMILAYALSIPIRQANGFGFINLNFLNLSLLGLGLLLHGRINNFLDALEQAIGGAAGILIQFPLYFGIMGIMRSSGLIDLVSEWFSAISTPTTFPLFTFLSAGLVNLFVPSGGGQWAVQGPIIIQASSELGVPLSKSIMALAYGDQITNMLQPFWALPLLGITGLKARDILPYTLLLLLLGTIIFMGVLLLF